jgi:hypothetical protein
LHSVIKDKPTCSHASFKTFYSIKLFKIKKKEQHAALKHEINIKKVHARAAGQLVKFGMNSSYNMKFIAK